MRYIATYRVLALAGLVLLGAADAGPSTSAPPQPKPQNFTAEAPPTARFGEPFPYTVHVTHPKGEVYALPRTPELGEFDLVSSEKDDQPNGEQVTTVFRLQLRPWSLGKKDVPELQLEVQTPQGMTRLPIPGPSIEIEGTIPDGGEADLRDIAPPVDIPVRTWRWVIALAVAVAVALIAFFVMRQLQKPKPQIAAPPAPPPEPLHVRTRRALEALLAEDLPGGGRQRELYFRLSEIVRRYLGERFGFDAIDLTTEELLTALRKRPTPGLDLAAFARQCSDADLVKFAKLQPDANACKTSVDEAIAMVMSTTAASAPALSQERSA